MGSNNITGELLFFFVKRNGYILSVFFYAVFFFTGVLAATNVAHDSDQNSSHLNEITFCKNTFIEDYSSIMLNYNEPYEKYIETAPYYMKKFLLSTKKTLMDLEKASEFLGSGVGKTKILANESFKKIVDYFKDKKLKAKEERYDYSLFIGLVMRECYFIDNIIILAKEFIEKKPQDILNKIKQFLDARFSLFFSENSLNYYVNIVREMKMSCVNEEEVKEKEKKSSHIFLEYLEKIDKCLTNGIHSLVRKDYNKVEEEVDSAKIDVPMEFINAMAEIKIILKDMETDKNMKPYENQIKSLYCLNEIEKNLNMKNEIIVGNIESIMKKLKDQIDKTKYEETDVNNLLRDLMHEYIKWDIVNVLDRRTSKISEFEIKMLNTLEKKNKHRDIGKKKDDILDWTVLKSFEIIANIIVNESIDTKMVDICKMLCFDFDKHSLEIAFVAAEHRNIFATLISSI